MKRVERVNLRLQAVTLLRVMKTTQTYAQLSDRTSLSENDLNRYVNGHVLPRFERARKLVGDVGFNELAEMLDARIDPDQEGYIDNTAVVFDQPFLDLIPPVAMEAFEFKTPEVILTAATDGITLASAMARFFDVDAVYAKESKETAVEDFIEVTTTLESGRELVYRFPSSNIKPGQRVLIVDDLIRTGETQELLLDIAEEANSEVVGVFVLIQVSNIGIQRVRERESAPVEAMISAD